MKSGVKMDLRSSLNAMKKQNCPWYQITVKADFELFQLRKIHTQLKTNANPRN